MKIRLHKVKNSCPCVDYSFLSLQISRTFSRTSDELLTSPLSKCGKRYTRISSSCSLMKLKSG